MQPDRANRELTEEDINLLSQYIDGELAAPESRALEARLHEESALQSVLVRMQELNQRLRDSLTERADIPEQITEMLKPEPKSPLEETGAIVLNFPGGVIPARRVESPRWAYALAASLVAAVALVLINNGNTPQNSLWDDSALVAAALDQTASGSEWTTLSDGRKIQPVLTFPHEDGNWCREYLLRGADADWRAVACKQGESWVTQAAGLESYLETADAYRPAGSNDAAPVAVFISQHAAGIALGLEQESKLIQSNWR
ncbi:MAG: anti-sigma factor [Congregibacter sp.]